MHTFEEARDALLSAAPRVGTERIAIAEAIGRVLAEDVRAPGPQPAFDYSVMDGYAVAVEDLPADSATPILTLQGESRTGGSTPERLERGTTCRIFTGALLPPRANAVVKQEEVARDGNVVQLLHRPRPGEFVRREGEDLASGEIALERGTRLRPQHLALLTALEVPAITVALRPTVSILSTGDELRAPGDPPRRGTVVDSSGPALAAFVEMVGGVPRRLSPARDEPKELLAALLAALDGADLVLTLGGASVGDHDLVRPALAEAGIALDFYKVAVKPGMPLVAGHAGTRRFLGLPGNPASSMVTFMLFAAPVIRAMQGDRTPLPPLLRARLEDEVSHATGRLEFARTLLAEREGHLWARVLSQQSSGSIVSMAQADGLALLPADTPRLASSSEVRVLRFADV